MNFNLKLKMICVYNQSSSMSSFKQSDPLRRKMLFMWPYHTAGKKIPAGSIGCFKPEGRTGTVDVLNERMSKLEKDINILKKDNSEQKTKIEAYEAQLKNLNDKNELLESIYREKTAIEFNNDVVQLVHALLHAKILELQRANVQF